MQFLIAYLMSLCDFICMTLYSLYRAIKKLLTHLPTQHLLHGCPLSVIRPSLLLLPVLGTVCPNMSRPHHLCLFSEVTSRLLSSGVPSHDFCSLCTNTGWGESGKVILQVSIAVFRVLSKFFSGSLWWQFGHLNRFCFLTYSKQKLYPLTSRELYNIWVFLFLQQIWYLLFLCLFHHPTPLLWLLLLQLKDLL